MMDYLSPPLFGSKRLKLAGGYVRVGSSRGVFVMWRQWGVVMWVWRWGMRIALG
jgi:hypothetical protein